jgi:polysaccharide deacetylase 2 family uncharacterized protein YibQ
MRRFPFFTVIIAAAVIAAVFLFLERATISEKPTPPEPQVAAIPGKSALVGKSRRESTPADATNQKAATSPAEKEHFRQVAIIIDDIGFDMQPLRKLAKIPFPIAFAVIPYAPHASEAAEFLFRSKKETLLHLPMEPLSYPRVSPGAGALLTTMNREEIIRQIREGLSVLPHVSGVNNHMGSKFTEDGPRMKIVMEELKKQGLYFVDSKTSPRSRGGEMAAQTGIRFAERNFFIDHNSGYKAAVASLNKASRQSRPEGPPMLLIGHPHADTIRAIEDILPQWEHEGVRIVSVKQCLSAQEQ